MSLNNRIRKLEVEIADFKDGGATDALLERLDTIRARLSVSDISDAQWCKSAPPIEIAAAAFSVQGMAMKECALWDRAGELARTDGAVGRLFSFMESIHAH